jgi:hypothetical protein
MGDEIRRAGAATAGPYTWAHVLAALELKIRYVDAAMI